MLKANLLKVRIVKTMLNYIEGKVGNLKTPA